MFGYPVFAKSILILIGLTAVSYVYAEAQATAASKPDAAALQCALRQYIPWVRAEGRPLDPDLKAKELQEIDKACGSSLHLSNVITAYDSLPGAPQQPKQPVATVIPAPPITPAANGPTFSELLSGPLDNLAAYLSQPGIDINARKANLETQ